jgi:hypothetical protein
MVDWPHAGLRGDRRPRPRPWWPWDPLRARLLAGLAEPASASALAQRVGLPRQKVNYHLRIHEDHGWLAEVGRRRWGGLTERDAAAPPRPSYVVSPGAARRGRRRPRPDPRPDVRRRYLIALGRPPVVREVAAPGPPGRPGRQSGCDRWPSTPRSASAPPPSGPRSPATWPTPSPPWCRATTTPALPAAAPTAWWWSPIPCRPAPDPTPRRDHRATRHDPSGTRAIDLDIEVPGPLSRSGRLRSPRARHHRLVRPGHGRRPRGRDRRARLRSRPRGRDGPGSPPGSRPAGSPSRSRARAAPPSRWSGWSRAATGTPAWSG